VRKCGVQQDRSSSLLFIFVLFAIEVIAITVVELPLNLTFYKFGFHDEGSNLTAHYLLSRGFSPTVDFGYPYGLLALVVNRALPSGPYAFQLAMLVVSLSISYALAVLVASLKLGRSAIALIIFAMPFAVMGLYGNYVHGMEAALLSNGIAQQARGKRGVALALATAAVLAKPALGYVYGLILLLAIFGHYMRSELPRSALLKTLAPAVITGIGLLTMLTVIFTVEPLMNTIISRSGMSGYRYLDYGFLHAGKTIWYYTGVRPGYYVGTVSGFYLLGTAALVLAGLVAMARIIRGDLNYCANEIVATCAALHTLFIVMMYGNSNSWQYYSYILVFGLAAATTLGAIPARTAWVFALMAAIGQKQSCTIISRLWRTTHRSPAVGDLWVLQDEDSEWEKVRRLAAGRKAVVVSWAGAAFEFAPEVVPRTALYLMPGNSSPIEIERQSTAIKQADIVILRDDLDFIDWSFKFDKIAEAVSQFHTVWKGRHFQVLERGVESRKALP